MYPVRRILCIMLGGCLLYGAGLVLLPEIEAGIFYGKATISAFVMACMGGVLVLMGAFPKLTRNW